MDSRSISHTKWKCQYHIVFIPKYRKKQLYGRVREDVRDIIKILLCCNNRQCHRISDKEVYSRAIRRVVERRE